MIAPRKVVECEKHGAVEHHWHKDSRCEAGGWWRCMECNREASRKYYHARGVHLMAENRECSSWLGIHIAERALSKFFDHIERLPNNSPGGDFRCGKGFLIDVKSGCLYTAKGEKTPYLRFYINHNTRADYLLCLGFTDRESLEPIHVWLIPGKKVNHLKSLRICMGPRSLAKWERYERPLDKVVACCNQMKAEAI